MQINIAKNLPAVSVDSGLIQQALNALLSNAMSYGKSDRPIEVSATRDDSMLVISVADRGAGLEPGEETQSISKVLSRSAHSSRWYRPRSVDCATIGRGQWRPDRCAEPPGRRCGVFHSFAYQ